MTMSDLCAFLRNWFIRRTDMQFGEFTIDGGRFMPPVHIEDGRYFRIIGSVFNDGCYRMTRTLSLQDETFSGAVWLMRVPPEVCALLAEINDWEQKFGEISLSPYQSESFGNYSYTKRSAGNADSADWTSIFGAKLAKWRKLN